MLTWWTGGQSINFVRIFCSLHIGDWLGDEAAELARLMARCGVGAWYRMGTCIIQHIEVRLNALMFHLY